MDRQTRDKITAGTDQQALLYGESACLETPPDLFAALDEEFHFDVDLFANELNSTCKVWFGPGSPVNEFDALAVKPWYYVPTLPEEIAQGMRSTTVGFANPPYGRFVGPALKKAKEEAEAGFCSVFLLPLRVTRAFKAIILPYADIRFCDERVKFWYHRAPKLQLDSKSGRMKHMGALFDSIIVVFRPRNPGMLFYPKPPEVWTWKTPGKMAMPIPPPADDPGIHRPDQPVEGD